MLKSLGVTSPTKQKRRRLAWLLAGLGSLPLLLALAGFIFLQTYDFDQLRPRLVQLVKEATGRDLTLGGPLKLKISWRPRLVIEDVALSQDSQQSGLPPLAKAKQVEIEVELWPLLTRRFLVVERLVLKELEVVALADSPLPPLPPLLPIPPSLAGPGTAAQTAPTTPSPEDRHGGNHKGSLDLTWFQLRQIEVRQAKLEWRRPGKAPLSIQLRSLDLEQSQAAGAMTVAVKGSLGQEAFELRGQAQPPETAGRPWSVKVSLVYPDLRAKVEGRIMEPMAARGLDLKVDIQAAPAGLGLGWPPGDWSLATKLGDPGPDTYRLEELKVSGPAGALEGWIQMDLQGERPRVSAELTSQDLDLRALWGQSPAAQPPPPQTPPAQASSASPAEQAPRPDKVFSRAPLPLAELRGLDLDLGLRAGVLKTTRLDLDEVDLRLKLRDGVLDLEPLKAKLAGGPLDLRLRLAPKGEQVQARLALGLGHCRLGQVLRRAGVQEVLGGGILEANLDLTGQGGSLAAIMAHLGGKTVIQVRGGSLNAQYLGLVGSDLAGGIASALGDVVKEPRDNRLKCLVLGLLVKDGLATTTALALDSDSLVMVGRGSINLRNEQLDLALRPLTKSGLMAPGGVGLGLGQPVKFKITGSLAQPRVSLDEGQVLATLGKSLGGLAVLGPLGLAVGLATGGEGDSELCRDAMAAAQKGVVYEPKRGVTRALEGVGQGVGGALRRLFGN